MSAIFIAATGQHRGKTTLSLGTFAALKKRFSSVGFIKPVGQKQVEVSPGIHVDKDVALFKNVFDIEDDWHLMSPLLIPPGFTKSFLDGEQDEKDYLKKIETSFSKIRKKHPFTIVEGTGHTSVGSIINCSNARVAKLLGLDIVLIAEAGLGSSFDELMLNISFCEKWDVSIRGVILNRALEEKREMIERYFPKALASLGIPLLGTLPYTPYLSELCARDFEKLFQTKLLSGQKKRFRHFEHMKLVAGSLESYLEEMTPRELIITPATRTDIIYACIQKHVEAREIEHTPHFGGGIILTDKHPPQENLIKDLIESDIPAIYAPICSFEVMKKINLYTSKIGKEEKEKIAKAIALVEKHVDINRLLSPSSYTISS